MDKIERLVRDAPHELARAYREAGQLPWLDVEARLDWRCNAKCKYCGVWKYGRENMLGIERWLSIFDELAAAGLARALFVGGEPMLYPHFHALIEHVDALGIETAVTTNGSMLKPDRVRRLAALRHLDEVTVSLDSADPEVHDAVRKLAGLFAIAVRGMALLRQAAPRVRLVVNTVVSAETVGSVGRILELPVLPDAIRLFPAVVDGAWLESLAGVVENDWGAWAEEAKTQRLSADSQARALDQLERLADTARERGVALEIDRLRLAWTNPYAGHCFVPHGHLVIQPGGEVYPCCHLQAPEHSLGSLRHASVRELVGGEPYLRFLDLVRPVRLRACGDCSRYRQFNEAASAALHAQSRTPA